MLSAKYREHANVLVFREILQQIGLSHRLAHGVENMRGFALFGRLVSIFSLNIGLLLARWNMQIGIATWLWDLRIVILHHRGHFLAFLLF